MLLTVKTGGLFRRPAAVDELHHSNADQNQEADFIGRPCHLLMGACGGKSGPVDHPRRILSLFLKVARQPVPTLIPSNFDCNL